MSTSSEGSVRKERRAESHVDVTTSKTPCRFVQDPFEVAKMRVLQIDAMPSTGETRRMGRIRIDAIVAAGADDLNRLALGEHCGLPALGEVWVAQQLREPSCFGLKKSVVHLPRAVLPSEQFSL